MARVSRCAAALSLAACAACASSPASNPPTGGLAAGSFTTAASTGSPSASALLFNGTSDVKWQMLYRRAEVGAAGHLTAIRFHRSASDTSGTVTCPRTTVRLGHSTLEPSAATSVTTAFFSNVDASAITTVFSGSLVIDAPSWFDVRLSAPYAYDGAENLVVEVETVERCSASLTLDTLNLGGSRHAASWAADADPAVADHSTTTAQSVDGYVAAAQFVFTGGDLRKEYGFLGGTCFPFSSSANGFKLQTLLLASDVNGAGPVTGLAFQLATDPSIAVTTELTVRLGHATAATLDTVFAANVAGELTTVADHLLVSVPAGLSQGAWIWVPLTGAFTYDGVRNLLVQTETSPNATPCGTRFQYGYRNGASIYAYNRAATTGVADVPCLLRHMALRFAGGPVFTPIDNGGTVAAGVAQIGQWQSSIPAVHLGVNGTITEAWFRIDRAVGLTTAATIPNVNVWMGTAGHAGLALGSTFASNFDAPVLVFSGSVQIPGGVHGGEWIRLPLQQPLSVDPAKNLVVLFTSDGGPAANHVAASFSSTAYPSYSVMRYTNPAGNTAYPDFTYDGFPQLRFTVAR